MKPLDRNISILEHIVGYCDQIEETIRRFGNDYGVFSADAIYRNAAALCVLQIGELAGKLTDEFRAEHPGAPWRQIRGMRNIVAHSYGTVDPEVTWEILTEDIPKLKTYCGIRALINERPTRWMPSEHLPGFFIPVLENPSVLRFISPPQTSHTHSIQCGLYVSARYIYFTMLIISFTT